MAPSSFLSISRELRDLIYLDALTCYASPPASPRTCNDRKRGGGFDGEEFFMDDCNLYPTRLPDITSSNLFLTNHQVHDEVKEVISRLERTDVLEYGLDCMLDCERRIYPTWLSLPAPSSRMGIIKTTLRLFGELSIGKRSGWKDGCGGPGMMTWGLFELLHRFLTRGANFLGKPTTMDITIGLLVLNVVTPEEPAEGFIAEEEYVNGYHSKAGSLINPRTMIHLLTNNINRMLSQKEGNLPRERIGKISLCLDGEEKKDWVFP